MQQPLWKRLLKLFDPATKAPAAQRARIADLVWELRKKSEAEIVEAIEQSAGAAAS